MSGILIAGNPEVTVGAIIHTFREPTNQAQVRSSRVQPAAICQPKVTQIPNSDS